MTPRNKGHFSAILAGIRDGGAEEGMVVQSFCNGYQQTMPNLQQTLDYRTVPPVACPMPDMLKEENKKKTITI